MRHILTNEFTFSKRMLGFILLLGGITGNLGLIALDIIRESEHGVGPQQRAAMIVLAMLAVIGLTLIPLGRAKA